MQVAVITPYYRESLELLETCHRSVAAQVHECRHVLVADGHPQASLDDWPIDHLCLRPTTILVLRHGLLAQFMPSVLVRM